jgi:hypothetical protein
MQDQAIRLTHNLKDLDAALVTARDKVALARAMLDRVLEQERREQVVAELAKLQAVAKRLDEALATFVAAARDAVDVVDQINSLGRPNPSRESFSALGYRAVLTKLGHTIWANRTRVMAPGERTTFADLADRWSVTADNKQTDEVAA